MQAAGGGGQERGAPAVFYILAEGSDAARLERLLCGTGSSWGLPEHDRDAWAEVRPGDLVYLGLVTSPTLRACCRVSGTSPGPGAEWEGRTRAVHFSHLRHVGVPYGDFERHAGAPHEPPRTLFRVPDGWAAHLLSERPVHGAIFEPAGATAPLDLVSPPDSVRYDVTRAIRETAMSRELRELYGDRCQVCGYSLEVAPGLRHSEVHHVHPLHEGGLDTPDNMVVLCPAHHAEFDYGALCVDASGRAVGRGGGEGKRLHFEPGHALAPHNVRYGMLKLGRAG